MKWYGKIDFLSMKGEIMETIHYDTEDEFNKEIKESYEIGRPIAPKIFKVEEYEEESGQVSQMRLNTVVKKGYEKVTRGLEKKYRDAYSTFSTCIEEARNPIDKKAAALEYIYNLNKIYKQYGDFIKYLDENVGTTIFELKGDYGISNKELGKVLQIPAKPSKEINFYKVSNDNNKELELSR